MQHGGDYWWLPACVSRCPRTCSISLEIALSAIGQMDASGAPHGLVPMQAAERQSPDFTPTLRAGVLPRGLRCCYRLPIARAIGCALRLVTIPARHCAAPKDIEQVLQKMRSPKPYFQARWAVLWRIRPCLNLTFSWPLAILCEVIATSAMKSSHGFTRLVPSIGTVLMYCVSFYALKTRHWR